MKIANLFRIRLFGSLLLLSTLVSCKTTTVVEPYADSRPYTRWWWFASEIDPADVRYQLEWMKSQGFGGVEIAWVYPMHADTTIKKPAWLSPEWAAPVNYAKRCADSLGLGCDFTYGTMWPFNDPDLPVADASRVYGQTSFPPTRKRAWDHPRVGHILNHLDSAAFNRYAAKLNAAMSEAYKGSPSGLFVDSWEVDSRNLWTEGFGDTFFARHGYRIEPLMDSLYMAGYEDLFYDYMCVLSDYALEGFYRPFAENARRTGGFSRAQCGGVPADLLAANMLVDVPETEAILYEPNYGRIAASAAALNDYPVVSSETFTCIYGWRKWGGKGPYQEQEQVADMRLVADALFANGTNQIFWHGMPYNRQGSKDNYFYASVHVGPDANFVDQLADFNRYMTTVSSYMRRGKVYSDVALYLPTEDAWMGGEYPDSLRMSWFWGKYEMRYEHAPKYLKGYQPLWVNGDVLSAACVEQGEMRYNTMSFKTLVVDVTYLDIAHLRSVLTLAKQGLPVVMARAPQQPGRNKSAEYQTMVAELMALPNVTSDTAQPLAHKPLLECEDLPEFWCRRDGSDLYIFVANPAACNLRYPLRYGQGFEGDACVRDLTINTPAGAQNYRLEMARNESCLLRVTADGAVERIPLNFEAKFIPAKEEAVSAKK